jgi:acyl carrier protein
MTSDEIYAAIAPVAEEILDIPKFDLSVTMMSTPVWDSLTHVRLLSAVEKKLGVEIDADEAFKLTSAAKLVRYLETLTGARA